ncbi:ferritin-like domain-containing protein [Verrucomicrobia bacterium LW23]|nr:ferritin-like domain-containing protein [Verrucomicrobia bacterium LW23]PTY04365.1 ferritin-like domain-containing protein [Verrucomicrobia bacterium LW23]
MNIFNLGKGKVTTLHELFLDQLRDLYSAETQLLTAIPEMAKAASAPDLKKGFQQHFEQTKVHAMRLEKIFKTFDESPEGKTCAAMKGLIAEGQETISENASKEVRDAALIAAAQRVEHYEMAGYGTVRTYAEMMGHTEAADLLQLTLDEEGETNKKLTEISRLVNSSVPIGHEVGARA